MATSLDGIPRPSVSLLKDGIEVKKDKVIEMKHKDDQIELLFEKVTLETAGNYILIAKNDVGEAKLEGVLNIIGRSIANDIKFGYLYLQDLHF